MTEAGTKRVEEIFCRALEAIDAAERRAYLDEACAGEPETRAAVERLLSSQPLAEDFFRESSSVLTPAIEALRVVAREQDFGEGNSAAVVEMEGEQVGPYKLLQKIGEGGCGVVYMAEQVQPVRRRVALKIIKLGMDTRNVIARFKAEQQALALMEHPNIAHVLDAGATDSGRPYFVMELVRGIKLTDYCDENRLEVRARLELFIQVCHAVQHAHQKGIIHRDIKPSNILVTMHDGVPVPKVIDFGIAKATAGRLTDNTLFTAYDQFVGTPAYMSPEQAEMSGLDVDTRSDIYSLGALLYELLAGRPPFEQQQLIDAGLDEMRRTLRETEPRPPSTLLTTLRRVGSTTTAKRGHADSRKLISELRGDLDWIVMKSLEKDRRRRYETADALALDVGRYLNNEAVLARPPSRVYRLRKLVQRNRVVFAAGTVVALALAAGFGVSMWLYTLEREARMEQMRLRHLAEMRQKLTQATVFLSRGQLAEADRLVAEVPLSEATPEYSGLYRAMGGWSAGHERWQEAGERIAVLLQLGATDVAETTMDYLRQAPVLVMAGDLAGYDEFRRSAIARYQGTQDPVLAERVIRCSCLMPGDSGMLASLQPLADLATRSIEPGVDQLNVGLSAWRAFSLSLMRYRQGDHAGAVAMGERALGYRFPNDSLNTNVRIVLGMARFGLGEAERARDELGKCRAVIEGIHESGTDYYWFDWLFARVLLQEAKELIRD